MEARAVGAVEAVTVAGSEAAAPVVVRVERVAARAAAARAVAVAHTRYSRSYMPTICQRKMMGRLHNSYL